jgi:hypothetical protein
MYFQEPRSNITDAGWFCGCGYRILVRAARLREESEQLRASRQRRRK